MVRPKGCQLLAVPLGLTLCSVFLVMLVVIGQHATYDLECTAEGKDDPLFDYVAFYECAGVMPKPVKGAILIAWLVLLISLLGSTADAFFVPLLEELSERMSLSEEVAGVTLLALGNGMPDIMTAASAISGEGDNLNGGLQLAMGEFFGAGCFIMLMVLGAILCCSTGRTQVEPKMFLVNVTAYFLCVCLMLGLTLHNQMAWWHSCILFVFYLTYVGVVILLGSRLRKQGHLSVVRSNISRSTISRIPSSMPDITGALSVDAGWDGLVSKHVSKASRLASLAEQSSESSDPSQDALAGLSFHEVDGFLALLQYVMEFPFSCARTLSIPSPCWSKRRRQLAALHPFFGLCVIIFAFSGGEGLTASWASLPAVVWAALLGVATSTAILRFSTPDRVPLWHSALIVFGMVATVAWFNIFANEVVAVLESLGKAFSVSDSTLGITVLAWGNCVGDVAADVALAKAGKSKMAVAGLFGSLIFSDALGLAISVLGATLQSGPFDALLGLGNQLAGGFLLSSLLLVVLVFSFFRFSCPRWFCIPLLVVY
jgi:sodium/potassium/calcium exchanger 6